MEILVRPMAPTDKGLPLGSHAFSTGKEWENFKHNQAEIFNHLLAVLPESNLAL